MYSLPQPLYGVLGNILNEENNEVKE